jgi:preprotein translocase subunit SecD
MRGIGRLVTSIVIVGALVIAAVVGFLTSVRPLLGLDLVGGVSVVLAGPKGTSREVMEKALDRIRDRVDALGVAEPDISLLGGNLIQVQLPGLGGQGHVVKRGSQFCALSSTDASLGCFTTLAAAQARAKAQSVQRVLQIIGTTARLEEREVLPPPGSQAAIGTSIPPTDAAYKKLAITTNPRANQNMVSYADSNNDGKFTNGVDPKYYLGPVEITGAALSKATAVFITSSQNQNSGQTGWQVNFTLNKQGAKTFADITTKLAVQHNELAIVLDGIVESAPQVQSAITGGVGEITGSFSEQQAKNLAVVLNSGALPVQLERQNVVTVSPTLGKQSLHQGLIAGIVGLIALMLYLAFYYRLLGVVTWLGMAIWGVLALGLVSLLGHTVGYALTLAGVAGIIVSLGITADSYIVFYERLKDEVRHGKSLRAAVQPAFKRSWRTIYTADTVTILAAVVLYLLAVGSVRGFALTLGLSTALDMFVVFFFKRPTVFLISRSPRLTGLRRLGLRSAVAADPVPVAGGER